MLCNARVPASTIRLLSNLVAKARQRDLDFRQLVRGSFRDEGLQLASGMVHVSEARFRRSLNHEGAPPEGMRTLAVPGRLNSLFLSVLPSGFGHANLDPGRNAE